MEYNGNIGSDTLQLQRVDAESWQRDIARHGRDLVKLFGTRGSNAVKHLTVNQILATFANQHARLGPHQYVQLANVAKFVEQLLNEHLAHKASSAGDEH